MLAPDWPRRAEALCARLVADGKLSSPEWQAAVRAVPRHELVPRCWVPDDRGRWTVMDTSTEDGRDAWLDLVYSNAAVVTMVATNAAGHTTVQSSSSMPSLMTRMLESLDVRDGHRVLEIGTGAGYNAALLCHRLGQGNVYSVDVEPELVDLARDRLAKIGYRPTLVAGDGALGLPDEAPFDRIIATTAVPAVPWPWIEQTRRGGVILADVKIRGQWGSLVRLIRTAPDRAEGSFDPVYGSFMRLRHEPNQAYPETARTPLPDDAPVVERSTTVDPRTPFTRLVVWFLAGLRLQPWIGLGYSGGDPRTAPRSVRLTAEDGSWTEVDLVATFSRHAVREAGPTKIWAEVERADQQWHDWDRPGWERFGLTVTPGQQRVWLDNPDSDQRWPVR
ncbi:methyltransferase domain-containing protein [Pseudonocardia eucalypti]